MLKKAIRTRYIDNVIHSDLNENLTNSIKKGLSNELLCIAKKLKIYYHGGASEKIFNKIISLNKEK